MPTVDRAAERPDGTREHARVIRPGPSGLRVATYLRAPLDTPGWTEHAQLEVIRRFVESSGWHLTSTGRPPRGLAPRARRSLRRYPMPGDLISLNDEIDTSTGDGALVFQVILALACSSVGSTGSGSDSRGQEPRGRG
jgi:hypothetical protein